MSEKLYDLDGEPMEDLEPDLETRVLQVKITVRNCENGRALDEMWLQRAIEDALPFHYASEIDVELLEEPRNIPQAP